MICFYPVLLSILSYNKSYFNFQFIQTQQFITSRAYEARYRNFPSIRNALFGSDHPLDDGTSTRPLSVTFYILTGLGILC